MGCRYRTVAALTVLLLTACSGIVQRHTDTPVQSLSAKTTVIYVVRRQWHIDIGVAAADLTSPLAALRAGLPGVRYLSMGFGDRHYLVARDQQYSGMLAALWPGPGVILVSGLTTSLQQAFGAAHVISIRITAAQERALQAFVSQSLSSQGRPIHPYAPGPYEGSRFFTTMHKYSALYTCNTWAAQALQAAKLPIRSAGVIFAGQLWVQVLHAANAGSMAKPRAAPQ